MLWLEALCRGPTYLGVGLPTLVLFNSPLPPAPGPSGPFHSGCVVRYVRVRWFGPAWPAGLVVLELVCWSPLSRLMAAIPPLETARCSFCRHKLPPVPYRLARRGAQPGVVAPARRFSCVAA